MSDRICITIAGPAPLRRGWSVPNTTTRQGARTPREYDSPAYRIVKNEDGTERRVRLAPRNGRA